MNGAFLSRNAFDNIEENASPEEICFQAHRIYAYYFLGVSKADIARIDGLDQTPAFDTIDMSDLI